MFLKELTLAPSLLVDNWHFWRWSFHTQLWYYHLWPMNLFTWRIQTGVFGQFHYFSSILLPLQIQNKHILTKKLWCKSFKDKAGMKKHRDNMLCFCSYIRLDILFKPRYLFCWLVGMPEGSGSDKYTQESYSLGVILRLAEGHLKL